LTQVAQDSVLIARVGVDGVPALITNRRSVYFVLFTHSGEMSLPIIVVNERSKNARKKETMSEKTMTIIVNTIAC